MVIVVIPFATALLADYIQEPDQKTAQIVYSGCSLAMAVTFKGMWRYASQRRRLLDAQVKPQAVENINRQFNIGPPLYTLTFALAFISAAVSLALCILLAVFYALPSSITRIARPHPDGA